MRLLQGMSAGFALLLGAAGARSQVAGAPAGTGIVSGSAGPVTVTVPAGYTTMPGIKGAPFSADVIEESDQMLVDGNHIHREMHGRIFRDSEGRTREENEWFPGGEKGMHIIIRDPLQQIFITLNPQSKVATVQHARIVTPAATRPTTAQADPSNVNPKPMERLGTMEMEGFQVIGSRFTHTMETGRIGNDKPIVMVSESWYSPELKESLLTKSHNPQSGQHIRKLVNIQIGNPDPLLFEPPSDYTVNEGPK